MNSTSPLSFLPVIALICLAGQSIAGTAEPKTPVATSPPSGLEAFFTQDYLLGTWGGKRTALKDAGLDMEAIYFGSLPTNFAGGIREETAYQQGLLMITDLDLDSIDAVDLAIQLQKLTGKRIQPQDFKDIRSVADVIGAVHRLMAA